MTQQARSLEATCGGIPGEAHGRSGPTLLDARDGAATG